MGKGRHMHRHRIWFIAGLFGVALLVGQPAMAQQVFASPEAAAKALIEAAGRPGEGMLDKIFGPGSQELLASGDADVDHQRIEQFLAAARGSSVIDGKDGRKLLAFGTNGWSFPIPLQQKGQEWTFDVAAGRIEILDRAIGRNEMTAIGACADYVAAQNEYFSTLHDDEPVQQFARKMLSTPGKHDGLYWEPATPSDRSPLGDRIAAAALENVRQDGKPQPYRGYIYRILTGQGQSAPGGAYSYLVNGRLLAGFALLAYPEKWQETGVMTFLCDQRGQVFEANLGPKTTALSADITRFNPGEGWQRVGD